MIEGHGLDKKSIRYALKKHKDLDGLASDCVGFANAAGGRILLGIEDDAVTPPEGQVIPVDLPDAIRKRISQVTVNVSVEPVKQAASNGSEYLEIVVAASPNIAGMSDGRYYLRISDETRKLLPDDLGRLLTDRTSLVWELATSLQVDVADVDPDQSRSFFDLIRSSSRVSEFVRSKSDAELLQHYFFTQNGKLTNLGILWIGRREDRARLSHAPVVQCIKYDELQNKVRKFVWDDYSLNPYQLVQAIWREVPDWKESHEIPFGLLRQSVPHFDEIVVRELLANAIVHRPYNQRGDIFINLYPDRLEVHNPGLLPIGVTPQNILHVSIPRNPHLAKVFYDLQMMEREGSGFDLMYKVLLSTGRPIPEVKEGNDRVQVTIQKRIVEKEIVDFMSKVDQTYQPTQKEQIALGLIAQHVSLTATEMVKLLALRNADDLRYWVGRLREWKLVGTRGQTKATEYFIASDVLRKLQFKGPTTLKGIERYRLRELILSDLKIYKQGKRADIHSRIGVEIPGTKLRRVMEELIEEGAIEKIGDRKGTVYRFVEKLPTQQAQNPDTK